MNSNSNSNMFQKLPPLVGQRIPAQSYVTGSTACGVVPDFWAHDVPNFGCGFNIDSNRYLKHTKCRCNAQACRCGAGCAAPRNIDDIFEDIKVDDSLNHVYASELVSSNQVLSSTKFSSMYGLRCGIPTACGNGSEHFGALHQSSHGDCALRKKFSRNVVG